MVETKANRRADAPTDRATSLKLAVFDILQEQAEDWTAFRRSRKKPYTLSYTRLHHHAHNLDNFTRRKWQIDSPDKGAWREQKHFRFRWLALIVLYPVRGLAARCASRNSQTCFALSCPAD